MRRWLSAARPAVAWVATHAMTCIKEVWARSVKAAIRRMVGRCGVLITPGRRISRCWERTRSCNALPVTATPRERSECRSCVRPVTRKMTAISDSTVCTASAAIRRIPGRARGSNETDAEATPHKLDLDAVCDAAHARGTASAGGGYGAADH